MFTPEERSTLRSELLALAAGDERISGAAITGSAAAEREDRWSDIDLAFGVADEAELPKVLADFTRCMYERHSAVHHTDIRFGSWIYRVFLLQATLQVDLGFVPATEFRPLGPAFRLISGKTNAGFEAPAQGAESTIGLAWLYALHARSCIARGQFWQAEYMISGVRDHVLTLACIRHGLPALHGRGFDELPSGVTEAFKGALVRELNAVDLIRALEVALEGLSIEVRCADRGLAGRLQPVLAVLTRSTRELAQPRQPKIP